MPLPQSYDAAPIEEHLRVHFTGETSMIDQQVEEAGLDTSKHGGNAYGASVTSSPTAISSYTIASTTSSDTTDVKVP